MDHWLESFARANFLRGAETAHDLKTPLNVAVLNLELLRMRLRKGSEEDDEKIAGYTRAIETELRRLGHIFDAFFLLSIPPRNGGAPEPVDVGAICASAAELAGMPFVADGVAMIEAHEARIRQAAQLFFQSAAKLLSAEGRTVTAGADGSVWSVTAGGRPRWPDFEATKIFKFYYTDSEGNPDLSVALARLIAETYGGELNATEDRDKVTLRLSFPLGAR